MDTNEHIAEAHEALYLLSTMEHLTRVSFRYQSSTGPVTVTVRKTVTAAATDRAQHSFAWEVTAEPHGGEQVGEQVYVTAQLAYQAALEAIRASMNSPATEPE